MSSIFGCACTCRILYHKSYLASLRSPPRRRMDSDEDTVSRLELRSWRVFCLTKQYTRTVWRERERYPISALLLHAPSTWSAAAIIVQHLEISYGTGYWSPLCHVRVFVCSRCEDFSLSMTSPCSTGTCLPSLDSPLHGLLSLLVFFCSIGLTHVSDPAQTTRVNLLEPFPHNCQRCCYS